jgi:hypothetical protein
LTERAAPGYTFRVRARDALGNVDVSPAFQVFQVDSTGPGVLISGSPLKNTVVSTTSATLTFTPIPGNEPATVTYDCKFNAEAAFSPCNGGFSAAGLVDGSQTLQVRARDRFDNLGAVVTYGWTISPIASNIFDVRTGTVPFDTRVSISSVATRMTGKTLNRFWIQDVDGNSTSPSPDHHGITVFPTNFNPNDSAMVAGRSVSVTGTVASVNGNPSLINASYVAGTLYPPYNLRDTNRDSAVLLNEANLGLFLNSAGTASKTAAASCQTGDFCIVSCMRTTPVINAIDATSGKIVINYDHFFQGNLERSGAASYYFIATDASQQNDACL